MSSLAGHAKLTHDMLVFMSIACVASYPAESFLSLMLDDNRVLRNYKDFKKSIDEELAYISSLPRFVWTRLSSVVGGDCEPEYLRDLSLKVRGRRKKWGARGKGGRVLSGQGIHFHSVRVCLRACFTSPRFRKRTATHSDKGAPCFLPSCWHS